MNQRLTQLFAAEHAFLSVVLAVSLVMNICLVLQIKAHGTREIKPLYSKNEGLPSISLVNDQGESFVLSYGEDSPKTLIYFFSTSCPWCSKNLVNLKALAEQSPGRFRLIALSTESPKVLAEHKRKNQITFPLYMISEADRRAYHLSATPASILLSPEGHPSNWWLGAYTSSKAQDLERVLSIKLPSIIATHESALTPIQGTGAR